MSVISSERSAIYHGHIYRYSKHLVFGHRWKRCLAVLGSNGDFEWFSDQHGKTLKGSINIKKFFNTIDVAEGLERTYGKKVIPKGPNIKDSIAGSVSSLPMASADTGKCCVFAIRYDESSDIDNITDDNKSTATGKTIDRSRDGTLQSGTIVQRTDGRLQKVSKDAHSSRVFWFCTSSEGELCDWVEMWSRLLGQLTLFHELRDKYEVSRPRGSGGSSSSMLRGTDPIKVTPMQAGDYGVTLGFMWDAIKASTETLSGVDTRYGDMTEVELKDVRLAEHQQPYEEPGFGPTGGTVLPEDSDSDDESGANDYRPARLVGVHQSNEYEHYDNVEAANFEDAVSAHIEDTVRNNQDNRLSKSGEKMSALISELHRNEVTEAYPVEIREPEIMKYSETTTGSRTGQFDMIANDRFRTDPGDSSFQATFRDSNIKQIKHSNDAEKHRRSVDFTYTDRNYSIHDINDGLGYGATVVSKEPDASNETHRRSSRRNSEPTLLEVVEEILRKYPIGREFSRKAGTLEEYRKMRDGISESDDYSLRRTSTHVGGGVEQNRWYREVNQNLDISAISTTETDTNGQFSTSNRGDYTARGSIQTDKSKTSSQKRLSTFDANSKLDHSSMLDTTTWSTEGEKTVDSADSNEALYSYLKSNEPRPGYQINPLDPNLPKSHHHSLINVDTTAPMPETEYIRKPGLLQFVGSSHTSRETDKHRYLKASTATRGGGKTGSKGKAEGLKTQSGRINRSMGDLRMLQPPKSPSHHAKSSNSRQTSALDLSGQAGIGGISPNAPQNVDYEADVETWRAKRKQRIAMSNINIHENAETKAVIEDSSTATTNRPAYYYDSSTEHGERTRQSMHPIIPPPDYEIVNY